MNLPISMKFMEFKYLEKTANYIHGNFDCNRYSTVQYTKNASHNHVYENSEVSYYCFGFVQIASYSM